MGKGDKICQLKWRYDETTPIEDIQKGILAVKKKAEIRKLEEVKPCPNTVLIGYLEEMLEEARTGDVIAGIFVCLHSGAKISDGWAGLHRVSKIELIGRLEMIKTEILGNMIRDEAAK